MTPALQETTSGLVFIVLLNLCADLRKAHEQQKMLLEEDFEKLRLSLQVLFQIQTH